MALQGAVDRYTPPPGYRPPAADAADAAFVRGLLSYAHRLSYSSAAPLGYQPGQPLYFFKPPAPQEAEMRVSQLHAFSRERVVGGGGGRVWAQQRGVLDRECCRRGGCRCGRGWENLQGRLGGMAFLRHHLP